MRQHKKKANNRKSKTTLPRKASRAIDPIFAAIDAWRRADAACVEVDGDIPDELADKCDDAYSEVLRTRPITPAGLAALTGWARERADWLRANGSQLYPKDLCALTAAIDDATRGVSGLEPWSPPLPAASRKFLSSEIECAVCDLPRMARLAELQLYQAVGELEHRDGKIVEIPDAASTELAVFAVSKMAQMAEQFEQLYLSDLRGRSG
jgi:hypothetical protein